MERTFIDVQPQNRASLPCFAGSQGLSSGPREIFQTVSRRVLLGNWASGIADSRKSSFVLCSTICTTRSTGYTGLSYKRQATSTHLNSHHGRSAPPKSGKASCVTLLVVFFRLRVCAY